MKPGNIAAEVEFLRSYCGGYFGENDLAVVGVCARGSARLAAVKVGDNYIHQIELNVTADTDELVIVDEGQFGTRLVDERAHDAELITVQEGTVEVVYAGADGVRCSS